jgi:hypothetical protein
MEKIVEVYKNLHKDPIYSIRDAKTKIVIGHGDAIFLKDVRFFVQQGGRNRVLKERRKNVHAFVRGTITYFKTDTVPLEGATYNPCRSGFFTLVGSGKAILKAELAFLGPEGLKVSVTT